MSWLVALTLKSILGSVIGSSFYNWFEDTKFGLWFQGQVDRFMEYFAEKYELELMKKDAKFRKQFPIQAERLDVLEADLQTIWDLPAVNKAIMNELKKKVK
jgi:hypothetical protein